MMEIAIAIFIIGALGLMIVSPGFCVVALLTLGGLGIMLFAGNEAASKRIRQEVHQQLISDCNDPYALADVAHGMKCPRGTKGNPK